jgi:hypothetical protein
LTRFTLSPAELLLSANALFRAERTQNIQALIREKLEDLRHYDVPAIERVAAICCWGRSGSLLLASYLDGHEDVVMLPAMRGADLYNFFEHYQSLPLRDKLIAYSAVQQFFSGDFAIPSTEYYASVQALLELYGHWPPEVLESRRTFVLFLHIAYNLALGRRPASPHPLMVYALHDWNNAIAAKVYEDFPRVQFIHTIRDPITLCDRMFDNWFAERNAFHPESHREMPTKPLRRRRFRFFALTSWRAAFQKFDGLSAISFLFLINRDRPHAGMESRTVAIRFEDLHCDAAETMRGLSHWLGLSYRATLLDSTFNGVPYVVTRDGTAWSGRRPEQVQRNPRNISLTDRALLFSLFYENFEAWNYSYPKRLGNPILRWIVFVSLVLIPMRMEIIVARAIFKQRIVPAFRDGKIAVVIKSLCRIMFYRFAIICLLVPEFLRRYGCGKTLLQVCQKRRRDASEFIAVAASEGREVGSCR